MAKKTKYSGHHLVIVESPAKAKTIGKYLGSNYTVKASMGHVRDLPANDLGVDIVRGFTPTYINVLDRKRVLSELGKAAKDSETVYLATDMDREGEAIAWHIQEALELPDERVQRVVFNEITKDAIQQAFAHPRNLDMDKVNAQQARRILDRIVGYQLSPLLWKKIAKGLSAGRVQSVAVRLIVEREWEIRAFVPTESWRIRAVFAPADIDAAALGKAWDQFHASHADDGEERTQKEVLAWLNEHGAFQAELVAWAGKPFEVGNFETALKVAQSLGFVSEKTERIVWEDYATKGLEKVRLIGRLDPARSVSYRVNDLATRRTESRPPAPFTTATLQQAASSQLSFGVSRTMRIAQQLYEGIDLGDGQGPVGLITYMRTDSTNLSKEAVGKIRDLVTQNFGPNYLPDRPNVFGKSKSAQEAHEAIRPTDVAFSPEIVEGHLTAEQEKLYSLIWRRTVACQMTPAQWDSTTVNIVAQTADGEAIFKATGKRLVFDGFLRVTRTTQNEDALLPSLSVGSPLSALALNPLQHFTSPPPRYSEASLVKALEAEGIGRPSTYASIIQTIQDRGYVEQIDRRLYATDKGQIVTEKLMEHFPTVMDIKFTSFMEDELDKIEEAHLDWVKVLGEFYEPFRTALDKAHTGMEAARAEPSPYKCPRCSKDMVYRWARTGRFLSCTGYPDCNGAYNVDRDGKPIIPKQLDIACDVCGKPMILRQSRLGPFLGCSGYPECTGTRPCDASGNPLKIVKDEEIERPCDECGVGTMKVKRKGRRAFLGCDAFPACKHTAPIPAEVALERKSAPAEDAGVSCEKCGKAMLIRRGKRGPFIACSGFPRCRNTHPFEKLEALKAAAPSVAAPASSDDGQESPAKAATSARKRSAAKVSGKAGAKGAAATAPGSAGGEAPPGFAWTRTGKLVVETWPEGALKCPDCGGELVLRNGRFGPFYSCSNFPRCKCSVNLRGDAKKRAAEEMPAPVKPKPVPTDIACPECGAKMLIRTGRSGPFLGCSAYPKCKTTQPLPEELMAANSGA